MMMTTTTTTTMMKKMRPPLSICLFTPSLLLFFFLFFLPSLHTGPLHVAASHAKHRNLVPRVCRSAAASDPNVDYAFCVRALLSARGNHAKGMKGLAIVAVKVAKANATATRSYVKKLLKGKVEDKYVRGCLQDCKELYSDAASALKDSKKAVREGRYDDANASLSSVADAPTTCHQGFEDKPGLRDPLKRRNEDMFQLAVIALSIVSSLGS